MSAFAALSSYSPEAVEVQTVHSWEAPDRRGQIQERSYLLDHASADCPRAIEAAGIGALTAAEEQLDGWPCAECFVDNPSRSERRLAERTDAEATYSERSGAGTGGASRGEEPASEKQLALLLALLRSSFLLADDGLSGADLERLAVAAAGAVGTGKRSASAAIDKLKARDLAPRWTSLADHDPRQQPERQPEAGLRTNRYASSCAACGAQVPAEAGWLVKGPSGWEVRHQGSCPAPGDAPAPAAGLDLSELPEGRYGIPGGETRLKVRIEKPTEGRWARYVFVKDAAEYGQGQRYGRQAPGESYSGKIVAELEAILADPAAAAARYGALTERCGLCNRKLEDKASVERGIGPICAAKHGWS